MGYIRTLEARLRDKKPGEDSKYDMDWEMLKTMKESLGMKVDFKTPTDLKEEERAKNAGWDPVTRRPIKPWNQFIFIYKLFI